MFISAAAPVSVFTVFAFTAPVVLPSRVFRTATANVVSSRVIASSAKPVIPLDA